MKIVLFQPQIPQNTGNIVRTCKVTGTQLILVNPGFDTSDRMLKRAGLDYWDGVDVTVTDSLPISPSCFFFSSKATKLYTEVEYTQESVLIFGSETTGLPEHYHITYPEQFVTLPMVENVRCLNLATSAGIAIYEAWRQQNFSRGSKSAADKVLDRLSVT